MTHNLENNRAYQFAMLESAMREGNRERAQEHLARLRQLGVEVRLSDDLATLVDRSKVEGVRDAD